MTEQKLKELLADMTLEEKVNQMSQVVGAFFNKDMDITAMGPMADKGFTPENERFPVPSWVPWAQKH